MARGGYAVFLSVTVVFLCTASAVLGFGEYAQRIRSPLEPFALTYADSSKELVVVQSSDGQGVKIPMVSAEEVGTLQAMVSPVSEGFVAGVAWCGEEGVLYWLVGKQQTPGAESYRLRRTDLDGWTLEEEGPEIQTDQDLKLGDMAYVPEKDAFAVVDFVRDKYLFIDRATGEVLEDTFDCPAGIKGNAWCYGLGITYVPGGFLDILVGHTADRRAMRVVRVDLNGNPVGISYNLDSPASERLPRWTTGIAYCLSEQGDFTVVADRTTSQLFLYQTPQPQALGLTGIEVTVQEKDIGPGQETESIIANFSWENNGTYDNIVLEYLVPSQGKFTTETSVEGSATQLSHPLPGEGVHTYRLVPSIGGESLPPGEVTVRTVAGSSISMTPLNSPGAFAVATVEEPEFTVYVAEISPREGAQAALVHMLRRGSEPGTFQEAGTINSPFPKNYLTLGLAWDSSNSELVWLGRSGERTYELAITSPDGTVLATGLPLVRNPFLQDQLGDICYHSGTGWFWAVASEHNEAFAFAPLEGDSKKGFEFVLEDGEGVRFELPGSLPGRSGSWGNPSGISMVQPAGPGADNVFYVGLGIVPENLNNPGIGEGYVKALVPVARNGSAHSRVVGQPVDMDVATNSGLLRGFEVDMEGQPAVLIAAQDTGVLHELRLPGEGPLFSRGDANGDGSLNISDALFILQYLFEGAAPPPCLDAADLNDAGTINLSDALSLLRHIFSLSEEPVIAPPFSLCGTDPTPDALSCNEYQPCQK